MTTYKKLLGTCIKSEKAAYIYKVYTKSASKNSPSNLALQYVKEGMSFLTYTAL